MSIKEWLAEVGDYMPYKRGTRRGTTFAPFEEKSHKSHALQDPALTQEMEKWSPRSLLNLPFSNVTFEQICKRFQVHDSVVRTLTRTDVPTFSCDNVEMDGLAQGENKSCLNSTFANYLRAFEYTTAAPQTPGIGIWLFRQLIMSSMVSHVQ